VLLNEVLMCAWPIAMFLDTAAVDLWSQDDGEEPFTSPSSRVRQSSSALARASVRLRALPCVGSRGGVGARVGADLRQPLIALVRSRRRSPST